MSSGGGEGEKIVPLTRKSSVKQKRPEMRACHVRRQHPALSYSLSWGSLEHQSTRSLAEALGRTNRLAVGAGQTPTCALPSPLLHNYTRFLLASLLYLFRSRFFIISERISFFFRMYHFHFFPTLKTYLLTERLSHFRTSLFRLFLSSQIVSPHKTSFYIFGVSLRGADSPKLTPPHWGTVTMMTRALSKKAGVGARERMLLRKNEGGLQSS